MSFSWYILEAFHVQQKALSFNFSPVLIRKYRHHHDVALILGTYSRKLTLLYNTPPSSVGCDWLESNIRFLP